VNLDPVHIQMGWVDLDLDRLHLQTNESFQVLDQLTGMRYLWQGSHNYVELSPQKVPAHIFRVLRRVRTEKDFDYYQ
jgi:starch synthase (maltosyl-transferring)